MALNVNTRIRWEAIKDIRCLQDLRGKKVLEVGCGLGFFTAWFAAQGADTLGVDVDRGALAFVSREYQIPTRLVDADREELPEGPFDVVFVGEVLEHMADPEGLMRKVAAVLAPSGCAVVTTPALEGLLTRTRGKQLAHEHGAQKHERIGFYKAELEDLADRAGLETAEHRYCLYTFAELFMQLTKLGYLASKKTYDGQSDVLAMTDKFSFKALRAIFPALWAFFRIESAVCGRLNLRGHCHVLVVRHRSSAP